MTDEPADILPIEPEQTVPDPHCRETERIIVLGTNGCGKSSLVKKMVIAECKKPEGHALVVTRHLNEWLTLPEVHARFRWRVGDYVKARRLIYRDGDLHHISENFRDGLLIFDDCRMYLHASTDQELLDMLIGSRQRGADVITVGHGFSQVPPTFFTFATRIILFRTRDNIMSRKDYILNFDELKEAQERINFRATDTARAWTDSGKIPDNKYYKEIIKV